MSITELFTSETSSISLRSPNACMVALPISPDQCPEESKELIGSEVDLIPRENS